MGDGLVAVGWSPDGLVEAIEPESAPGWVASVQWHPEDTAASDPAQQGLFDALVGQAQTSPRRRQGGPTRSASCRDWATSCPSSPQSRPSSSR